MAAHGTASLAGHKNLVALTRNVQALRPSLTVTLGFMDVLLPTVTDVLKALPGRAVVVPALLSTGYHVTTDLPRAVRRRGARVARHLGPDPLLIQAVADQLALARGSEVAGAPVALVAAGSSDPAARAELESAATALAEHLGVEVFATSVIDPDVDLAGKEVARYLLAEGSMADKIADRAAAAGVTVVSAPIGMHPAVAELVLKRYDESLAS